jgi:hypothetical protein
VAGFYAGENFPAQVVVALRALGHDDLTSLEAGNANQRVPDDAVLAFAATAGRALLTINRRDFIRLHRSQPEHARIVVCSQDPDVQGQAARIHEGVASEESLAGKLVRVNLPDR